MPSSVLFPYRPLEDAVDSYWRDSKSHKQAAAAWQMFKSSIIANSIIHYGVRSQSTPAMVKEALHLSWEDACVTLRGGGDNSMTGPLLSMWVNMHHEADRIKLGQVMNDRLVEIYTRANALGYKHRYDAIWRAGPVITDDTKFTGAVMIPATGGRLERWAYDEGLDTEFTRRFMLESMHSTAEDAKYLANEQVDVDDTDFAAHIQALDSGCPSPSEPMG